MMSYQEKTLQAADGKSINYYHWKPHTEREPKAVIQIAHGMAEHARRYDRFARFLVEKGYAVLAHDHRGHGKTAGSPTAIGYLEEGDFWEKAISDMKDLNELIKKQYPGRPVFFFGHSMGSLLGRDFIAQNGVQLNGAVLSGTGGDPGLLGKIGLLIAKLEALFKGRKKLSPMLNSLSFGKFNQSFQPNRTAFDWLSRDQQEVDKYVDDPWCGTVFTTGFFIDLIRGVNKINNATTFAATPKDLPVFLVAGDKDPVGDMGKGVTEVFENYKKAGLEQVTCQLYTNARHEILNETNWEAVFTDILNWIEKN